MRERTPSERTLLPGLRQKRWRTHRQRALAGLHRLSAIGTHNAETKRNPSTHMNQLKILPKTLNANSRQSAAGVTLVTQLTSNEKADSTVDIDKTAHKAPIFLVHRPLGACLWAR